MTPQERQLLNELFERLAALENAPRDPDAIDAINQGLDRAPNALYPLVQTVLVQDEALKRADARIRELEDELDAKPASAAPQPGFLDGMRDTLLGRERHGSVPSVRPDAVAAPASKWGSGQALPPGYAPVQQQGGYGQAQPGYAEPQQQPMAGGSFLGTAAATAAGVVGGAMLMNSMRGLFGGQQGQGKGHSAFDQGGQGGAPWSPGSGGDLARQAGVEDIGRGGGGGRTAALDDSSQRAGLFDTAQNDAQSDGDDFDADSDTDIA